TVGLDGRTCASINMLGKQSPDLNQGVDRKKPEEQGAGDQGLMFGFACDEAPEFMPAPLFYSHRLVEQQAKVRKSGKLKWLRPDAKSQVTLRYEDNTNRILGCDAVVLSTQHDEDVKHSHLVEAVRETILKPVLPKKWMEALKKNQLHINPTGKFGLMWIWFFFSASIHFFGSTGLRIEALKEEPDPHQPDRQVRDRRSRGRLRPDRPQDHRRL